MQRSSDWAWSAAAIVAGLALLHCGARTTLTDDPEVLAEAGGGADSSGAGGSACEPSPPCAGSTGELEAYARVYASPCGNVTVNRRGPPVPICHHIK